MIPRGMGPRPTSAVAPPPSFVAFALAVLLALSLVLGLSCVAAPPPNTSEARTPFDWQLPPGFPAPAVPADDPITPEKVRLGRHLFYDQRLSGNGTQACASCHRQERAFTDGRAHALGSTGAVHPRSSMSLANAAYAVSLTWADPRRTRLEDQALVPLTNTQPIEMGTLGHEAEVLARLREDPVYRDLFARAFPGARDAVSLGNVTRAIASFERTLISGRSPYDALVWEGDTAALSESAWRGMKLFFDKRLACAACHAGFTFSGPARWEGAQAPAPSFQDNGLSGLTPESDAGLFAISHRPIDRGRFRAPTLRNIAVTAPYMHDGRLPTLESVIAHYARGGTPGPNRNPLVKGFAITPEETCDLVAFLECLTDRTFLSDLRFGDPWRHISP